MICDMKGEGKRFTYERVFINKYGLPTYETKEIAIQKRRASNPSESIIITANRAKLLL